MAQPSIRAGIIIEDSQLVDTYDEFGFIYISSDNRIAAPEKKRETTTYAEEEGEHVDLRTVDDVFDYKVKFLIETPNTNLESANAKIKTFNEAIRKVDPVTGIKTCKRVWLYNYYKRVVICGIPEIIAEPTDFYRRLKGDALDCVQVELTIHVDIPSLCDFNLQLDPDNATR